MAGTVNTQAPSSAEEGQQPLRGVISPVGLKLWLWGDTADPVGGSLETVGAVQGAQSSNW